MKGLYCYVDRQSRRMIYVGKSHSDIDVRILCHNRCMYQDSKFEQYINDCDIYYVELLDDEEISSLEKKLIYVYRPELNDHLNNRRGSYIPLIKRLDWKKWRADNSKKIMHPAEVAFYNAIRAQYCLYDGKEVGRI